MIDWFRVTCSECQAKHTWPNVGTEDHPYRWKTARLTCPRCKQRQKVMLYQEGRELPTPQELLKVAERFEKTMPPLAKVAIEQLQRGVHAEATPKTEKDDWGTDEF